VALGQAAKLAAAEPDSTRHEDCLAEELCNVRNPFTAWTDINPHWLDRIAHVQNVLKDDSSLGVQGKGVNNSGQGVHSPVRYAYWQEPATVWLVTLLLVSQNKGAKPSMKLLQDSWWWAPLDGIPGVASVGHAGSSSVSSTVSWSKCHKKVHVAYLLEGSQEGICSVIATQTIALLLLIHSCIKRKRAVAWLLLAIPSS